MASSKSPQAAQACRLPTRLTMRDLAAARRVLTYASRGADRPGRLPGRRFHPGRRRDAGRQGPRHRQRHGQVRPCRPQDRRHLLLHRHARLFRPSRRSQPWRPGRDHRPGCAAAAVLGRRDGGTVRPHHLCQALPHSPDRHRRQCRTPPWRKAADVALLLPRRAGSLPDGPGAHHLHHHDAGAGRCAGGGADGAQGLFARPVSRLPSRRHPGPRPDPRHRPDACGRRNAAGARRHAACATCC